MKGVVPDIVFPDYYNYMDFGEKDLDFAMPWSEIQPLTWESWVPPYDKNYIIGMSNKRISEDETLQLIEENGKRLKEIREYTQFSLKYDEYASLIEEREAVAEKFKSIGKDDLGIDIASLEADQADIASDSSKMARTDAWLKDLRKDIYLFESFNVLKDIAAYEVKNARKEEQE